MLYAILNNDKVEATPKSYAKCPLCGMEVFSKCGEINIWHWSHKKHESCDNWYEPETQWHKNWKDVFGKDRIEIVLKKDGKKHFADIYTEDNIVIELQNSPIQKHVIRERENFYGEKMLWLINGFSFLLNFTMHNESTNRDWIPYNNGWVNFITGEFSNIPVNKKSRKMVFNWAWARKSWDEAIRPILIDFGDNELFMVTEGMGSSYGKGLRIQKSSFIQKYKGDLDKLDLVISKNKLKP